MSNDVFKPVNIFIDGGDEIERDMIGNVVSQTLIDNGFSDVKLLNSVGDMVVNNDNDMASILDAVVSLRPQLFKTPMVINAGAVRPVEVISATIQVEADLRETALNNMIKNADKVMEKTVEAVQLVLGTEEPAPKSKVDQFLKRYAASQEEA